MKSQRKGVTLIEALMAIFVTAIGLLSLLVLFPVGAFRMAQAITDDRSAHAATNAFAIAEATNLQNDPLITVGDQLPATLINIGNAFTGPQYVPAAPQKVPDLTTLAGYDGPSYPVYVDPNGYFANQAPLGQVTPGIGIPRRSVTYANTAGLARYWFALPDDLSYSNDGPYAGLAADLNSAPALQPTRDGTYTASFMLRRPRFQVSSVVEKTVVVYKNRGSIGGENVYSNIKFDPSTSEVLVTWAAGTQEDPPIRKGSWILDATVLGPTPPKGVAPYNYPEPHGYFYRVVNVTDAGAGNMIIELQSPPKQSTVDANNNGYGVLIVMENVVEVFEKGPGWKP
jgi:hypothetical protein